MRTFFESIEGKMRNELASAIDYRMLSVCFIHLFRNRKIVHKENLIGNLSLPVSLILFDVEKSRPTSFLAGRGDPLRVLRNTESSLRSRVHYFSLRKHLFGKYLLLSRSPSCAGLVFKKMESLFCSDDPDFYPSFPSSKGFRLRIKSVLLRLISFVSHFSYDKGRKQSTQSRHCSTEKIYRSWEFCPDEKQTKEDKTCAYQQPFYQCCFHLDFLRGLNRYLSLQTKFYSYPRRPLFLGALGKVKALLAPRACLKTMLLQAFTSRFIAWSQYLCIAKFSSHLFRTRSGRIGQRRCFLFSKKMPEALLKLLIVLAFSLITLSLHNAGRVVIENLPMSRRERLLIAIPAVLGFFLFSSLTFSENYTTTLPDFFMIKDRQEEGLVYLAAALGIIAGLITLEFRK